jgi:hypothetical protein
MAWTFGIAEVSAGVYEGRGFRNNRIVLSRSGSQVDTALLFDDAFRFEVREGTDVLAAVFAVTRGALPNSRSEYLSRSFGSWYVETTRNGGRVTFDGRDDRLVVEGADRKLLWEGTVTSANDVKPCIFEHIARIAGV